MMKTDITKYYNMAMYLLVILFCTFLALIIVNLAKADEYIDLDQIQASQELDILPLECGIERETPSTTFMRQSNQANGLTIYAFDTNKDGINDVQIAIPTGDHNRFPLFYTFDRDYDNTPELTYVDKMRDGTCKMIEVYWTKQKGYLQPKVLNDFKEGA